MMSVFTHPFYHLQCLNFNLLNLVSDSGSAQTAMHFL